MVNSTSIFKAGTKLSGIFPQRICNSLRFRVLAQINATGKILLEVHPGVFLKLDLSDWLHRLYYLGFVEQNTFKIIKKLLPVDGVFVDIGANIGIYSCIMANHVGAKGSVIAFEPMPENLEPLYNNIALNQLKNVEVNELALSNRQENFNLYVPSAHQQGATGCTQVWNPGDWVSVGTTEATTLDIAFQKQRLDFIKIDTQGHELEILQGAFSTIERFQPLILCEVFEENRTKVFDLIKSWNYAIYKETPNGFLSTSLPSEGWVDVFLIPQDKVEKVMTVLSTGKTYE
ncbi:FkbM family methyltransferase [Calothrix sp. CCY 0018]|uniref:FkbM family methyltransferase n=1 Tax=Calothrix sp. CCY 0018 TaxID=3103864 RepID=UPI0039C6DEE8